MNGTFTIDERRGLWILSSIVLLSRAAFALLNQRLIYGGPFVDDAYYALAVARHAALGNGITADGIHLTNGFQPLNTFLQFCCFTLVHGDRIAGLRVAYLLSGMIEIAFLWSMASLIASMRRERKSGQRWWQSPILIAAFFQTVLYRLLLAHTNGLETALAGTLLVLALCEYWQMELSQRAGTVPSVGRLIRLGIVLGFLVLARIDTAIFVLIVAALQFRFPKGVRNAAIIGMASLLISLPWWLFNIMSFGSLMPMSGQSESIYRWSPGMLLDGLDAAMNIVFFWIPKASTILPRWIGFAFYVGALFLSFWAIRKGGIWQKMKLRYDLRVLGPLWYFGIFLFFYYLFFFRATWFLERFWHPIEIGWIILFSLVLSECWEWFQSRSQNVRRWCGASVTLLLLGAAAMNVRWDRSLYLPVYPTDLAELGFWTEAHPGTKVGALQSGEAGFISDRILNLDGKVNADALHARQKDSLGAYIRSERFDYLADEAITIDMVLRDSARFGYRCMLQDSIRSVRIYRVSYP
ncbi:MAG TPA: hypothetical protein VGM92_00865 [Candidatus Kapabacteria bacterium]|jgi:hypothetical protein